MDCPNCGGDAEIVSRNTYSVLIACEFCGHHLVPQDGLPDEYGDWEDYSVEPLDDDPPPAA